MKKYIRDETKRIIKWASNNRNTFKKISGTNGHMSPEEYWKHFKLLRDNKLYDFLFLFIMSNQESIQIYEFFEDLGIQKFSESLDKHILDKLERYIMKEIEIEKQHIRIKCEI